MTVTAPNNQTVGQPLMLTCNVTTVRGITSQVDIEWRREGNTLNRLNNVTQTLVDSLLLYTDTYVISPLSTDDDGSEYKCTIVINTSPMIRYSDSIALDVTGKYQLLNCASVC